MALTVTLYDCCQRPLVPALVVFNFTIPMSTLRMTNNTVFHCNSIQILKNFLQMFLQKSSTFISKNDCYPKTLPRQGISQPKFHGNVIYNLRIVNVQTFCSYNFQQIH